MAERIAGQSRVRNVVCLAVLSGSLLGCRNPSPPESRITIMQSEAPLTMDPGDHNATFTHDVLDPMYEGLTKFDQNLQIVPSLATKWSVDASGTRWTLQLRSGVYFHDGTLFDAPAVVAQIADWLYALARQGLGVLLIEQKLSIALRISHRVYVMGHGRIVFEGTPDQLRANDEVRKEWLEV